MRLPPLVLALLLPCLAHAQVPELGGEGPERLLQHVLQAEFDANALSRLYRVAGRVEAEQAQDYYQDSLDLDFSPFFLVDHFEVVHHWRERPDLHHAWVLFHRLGEFDYLPGPRLGHNRFVRAGSELVCVQFSLVLDEAHGWLLKDPPKPSVFVESVVPEAESWVHIHETTLARNPGDPPSRKRYLLSHARGELAALKAMQAERGTREALPQVKCPP
jgi:hypothetical protein